MPKTATKAEVKTAYSLPQASPSARHSLKKGRTSLTSTSVIKNPSAVHGLRDEAKTKNQVEAAIRCEILHPLGVKHAAKAWIQKDPKSALRQNFTRLDRLLASIRHLDGMRIADKKHVPTSAYC